jgi:hypothetical protein
VSAVWSKEDEPYFIIFTFSRNFIYLTNGVPELGPRVNAL